ncbi:hypothetical protein EJ08DRAFT_700345 [Tothia fuscella]|uniref:Glyoxal oxidase N-terminal domain-containing protein n=1 Tax=Tothia fuscella TaxID=1048955 RepID=A0A9P4NKY5_9PEZI|nr:hypothetical protein EJ08DRAFT_700345 [Tothia fuscella]
MHDGICLTLPGSIGTAPPPGVSTGTAPAPLVPGPSETSAAPGIPVPPSPGERGESESSLDAHAVHEDKGLVVRDYAATVTMWLHDGICLTFPGITGTAPPPGWLLMELPTQFLLLMASGPGFGMADQPITRALLYDPERPLGKRFTQAATSDLARTYHSAAIQLKDGRIMIAGSNPNEHSVFLANKPLDCICYKD